MNTRQAIKAAALFVASFAILFAVSVAQAQTYVFTAELQDPPGGSSVVGTNTGTMSGGTISTTAGPGGPWPSAIVFNGSNQVGFSAVTAFGSNFTFLIWVRQSADQTQYHSPFYSRGATVNVAGIHNPVSGSTRVGYALNTIYAYSGGPIVPLNKWVLVAVAFQSGSTKMYVISDSGTSVATDSATFSAISYLQNPTIGADSFGGRRFTGALAGARVASSTMSQAQLEAYYALATPPMRPQVILSQRLDRLKLQAESLAKYQVYALAP